MGQGRPCAKAEDKEILKAHGWPAEAVPIRPNPKPNYRNYSNPFSTCTKTPFQDGMRQSSPVLALEENNRTPPSIVGRGTA